MSTNSWKINRGVTLNPQGSVPTSPTNGDMYYDSTANTFILYNNGVWVNLVSRTDVPSATSLTSVNFTAAVVQNPFVRITGSTASNLYGLTASTDGKMVIIYNQSSATCTVEENNATEPTAANRIITMAGANINLLSGMMAAFIYDASQSRWICDTFAPPSTSQSAYPDYFATSEADLSAAITNAGIGGGGVICLLNAFSISSSHVIPTNTLLLGRKGASVITVASGGSLTFSDYADMKDVYITTALTSGTLVTLSNVRSRVEGCHLTVPGSSTTVCINVTGNFNLIEDSAFFGVAAPSTGVGIQYTSGTGNVDTNCVFES